MRNQVFYQPLSLSPQHDHTTWPDSEISEDDHCNPPKEDSGLRPLFVSLLWWFSWRGTALRRFLVPLLLLVALLVFVVAACAQGRGLHSIGGSTLERKDGQWCNAGPPVSGAQMWEPSLDGDPVQIKVLTYNLEWWSLFGERGGSNGSAGKLIASAGRPQPFDLLGFQECEDAQRVLSDAGFIGKYTGIQGDRALCMAYYEPGWQHLAQGQEHIAEDQPSEYFGKRAVQWVRLAHKSTGKVVFFANHHGPLVVNSGGVCGGVATAGNLLKVITDNAAEGDAIILVGDFNADASSQTVAELGKHLFKVYTGAAFGGIDHVFTNARINSFARNLGPGGSDHDALTIVVEVSAEALPPYQHPGAPILTTSTSTTSLSTTTSSTSSPTTTITSIAAQSTAIGLPAAPPPEPVAMLVPEPPPVMVNAESLPPSTTPAESLPATELLDPSTVAARVLPPEQPAEPPGTQPPATATSRPTPIPWAYLLPPEVVQQETPQSATSLALQDTLLPNLPPRA